MRIAASLSSGVVSDDNELLGPDLISDNILKAKEDFGLAKIKVFSHNGEVIYSTDSEDIGKVNSKTYFQHIVAKGNSYTNVVRKDRKTLEDQVMKVDVVETYVPIMLDRRFLGAFEIYFDITTMNQEVNKKVFRSSLVSYLLMFGFFVTVMILMLKTENQGTERELKNKKVLYESAFYLMLVMAVSIFAAESVVMFFLSEFPPMSDMSSALIDSALLVLLVSPVLYYFLFRPLILQIERRTKAEEKLKKAHRELASANEQLIYENAERKKAEQKMFLAKQEWESTFNIITDMITIHDSDYNLIRANKAAKEMLSLPLVRDRQQMKCYQYYHGADKPPEGCPSCKCLQTGEPSSFEVYEPHLKKHIEIRAIPRIDEHNKVNGLIHVVRDITERKKMEHMLQEMSLRDELTGLYNRRGFFTMLEQQLKVMRRQGKRLFLLYADLDKFKEINDTFGHQEGDNVLVGVAEILRATYRESDLIARLGGDEFVVFPVDKDEAYVGMIVDRLQKNIDEYNERSGRDYELSMSIGVAPYDPESVTSIDTVLADADSMMYEQKRKKKKGRV